MDPLTALPVQGGRVINRREAAYAASVAAATDSRTSLAVGSAVLSGLIGPRAAATG